MDPEGLSLRLMGPPVIEVDGQALRVDTRKAVALLAYLAIEGPHSRESLAALLWPDSDGTRARAALRRTLSVLNRALGGRWLAAERPLLRLTGPGWWCDVVEFRETVAAGAAEDPERLARLEVAASLYRGPLLEGFTLRDGAAFEDWLIPQAERLRRDVAAVLDRLVEGQIEAGRLEEAAATARRLIELDVLHEPAHRRLMLLYAWLGRRGDAVRQYRQCVTVLDGELGVPPLEETADLHQAIVEGRAPPPPRAGGSAPRRTPRPPPQMSSSAPTALPMVGRDDALGALLDAHAAIDGTGRLLTLVGEAGIGKTRLAQELIEQVRAEGGVVIAVRAHPGDQHLAYAPVAEALREALRRPPKPGWLDLVPDYWRAEAARLVPELSLPTHTAPSEPLASPGAQMRFVEGVWHVLAAALAGPAPGVLFVDDLHRADEATLDLLAYAVARPDGRPFAILASWRGEDLPDGSRWPDVVADAIEGATCSEFALERLEAGAVEALLTSAGVDSGSSLAARIHAEAEGLPLAIVAYLEERCADPAMPWPLPRGLQQLFHARLSTLDGSSGQVLTAAAVIGRSFDVDTLVIAGGRTEAETVTALETLVARGFVRELVDATVRFDFTHDKLRSVAYAAASLARTRLLHRRVADALRSRARGGEPEAALAGLIAHHEQLAGREDEAARMHAAAGAHARRLYANAEALEHLRQALALGHPDVSALQEAIGDVATLDGDYRSALASYEASVAGLEDAAAVAAVEHKIAQVHLRAGDAAAANAHLEAALAGFEGLDAPAERARVLADRSLAAAMESDLAGARRAGREALTLAERAGDRRALAQARNILGLLARREGRLGEAQQQFEISADLAGQLPEPDARVAALNNLALAIAAAGKTDHALAHLREAASLCGRIGDRHRQAALHNNIADVLHAAGREEEAMAELKAAVVLFAGVGGADERQPEIFKLVDW